MPARGGFFLSNERAGTPCTQMVGDSAGMHWNVYLFGKFGAPDHPAHPALAPMDSHPDQNRVLRLAW